MRARRERPAVSLNRAVYDAFSQRARELGRSMASIVDELSHDLRIPPKELERRRELEEAEELARYNLEQTRRMVRGTGIYCASCITAEITIDDGESYLDGAPICRACDEEHPRSGRYSFDDGAKAVESTSWRGDNLGSGNRRKSAHR